MLVMKVMKTREDLQLLRPQLKVPKWRPEEPRITRKPEPEQV